MKVSISDRARYFNINIIFSQLGSLFKNKNKELLLLVELVPVPSNSLFPAIFKGTLVPPAVTGFITIRDPAISGAPINMNNAISRCLVLAPDSILSGIPALLSELIYIFTTLLYRIIEVMPVPSTLTFTFSLIIFTKGVSNTSIPLFHISLTVISPALPKGLLWANGAGDSILDLLNNCGFITVYKFI
jgi:hypothetical protein